MVATRTRFRGGARPGVGELARGSPTFAPVVAGWRRWTVEPQRQKAPRVRGLVGELGSAGLVPARARQGKLAALGLAEAGVGALGLHVRGLFLFQLR